MQFKREKKKTPPVYQNRHPLVIVGNSAIFVIVNGGFCVFFFFSVFVFVFIFRFWFCLFFCQEITKMEAKISHLADNGSVRFGSDRIG